NETYTYHGENIISLAWYYLISGAEDVKDVLVASVPYYPISTFKGIGEYYTAVSWKHYWNQVGPQTAYIVGALADDPYNLDLGSTANIDVCAFVYKPSLPIAAPEQPDNYTLFDRNIQGPRARYGDFGFAASARVVDNYENYPEQTIGVGKSTIAGAHVLSESGFAFNAAIDIVGLEIKVSTGAETEDRRRRYRFLTTDEKSSNTNAQQINGVTSTYNPSSKTLSDSNPYEKLNWIIHEQWITMPDRIVGHLTVNSLIDNQQAYAVNSIVKMVAGRASWGVKREIVDLGNGHYAYGKIHFIIKEENLGGQTITEFAPVYSETTANMSEKSIWHRILDNKSSGQPEQLFSYDIADKYYYVIEIFEENTIPANTISASRAGDFHSLTVDDGNRKIQSVMNITDQSQSYIVDFTAPYSQASILKSWANDEAFGTNIPMNQNLNIPAHASMLIIESSDSEDVAVQENYYQDIFNTDSLCPIGTPCNDGDPCTTNDVYIANCLCEGTFLDNNNNTVCDFEDCELVLASSDDGNIASNTLDDDLNTYWGASAGELIEYCLDEVTMLSAIGIAFRRGNEQTLNFDLELSVDGENWLSVLCNARSSGTTNDIQIFDFKSIQAKKIRITGYGGSDNNRNELTEVKWYPAIYLEAEDANIVAKWEVESDSAASASAYVVMNIDVIDQSASDSDALTYDFEVSSDGDYNIWARTIAPNGNDDSFWIKIDDGDWTVWSVPRTADWKWNKVLNTTYSFTTGMHRLYVQYRENGVKLDILCLTSSELSAPVELRAISPDYSVYFEAECAMLTGAWEVESDTSASGGSYAINNTVNNTGPQTEATGATALAFQFDVLTSGDYDFWTRTITANGGDDSFWIKMDDGDWTLWSVPIKSSWGWDKILNQTYNLSVGTHQLYINYRENGAKLDKIYAASSDACEPQGIIGQAINCVPVCTAGTLCDDGDPCTINDVYDTNCNCSGTPLIDSDSDGICDLSDQCPGFDDNVDENRNGIPDACENCEISKTFDNENIQTGAYFVEESITTTGNVIVEADSIVTLSAGNSITMQVGFHAQVGASFIAQISDCLTAPNTQMVESRKQNVNKAITIAPNPVNDRLQLNFQLEEAAAVSIGIYDLNGRLVQQLPLRSLSAGQYQEDVAVSDLVAGVYLLSLRTETQVQTVRFVVSR
ncbi:MAG: T9SS type A sorting domain-containing protein, partial [Bacteroidota bacterium]